MSSSTSIKRLTVSAIGLSLAVLGTLAKADVVAIVSSKSTVPALNKDQASDIFLGKASRFPDGTQAVPVDQQEGSGTRDAFYTKVAGKTAAQIKAYWAKIIFTGRGEPPREVADGAEMKRFVVANPGAIGYIEDKFVDSSVRVVL